MALIHIKMKKRRWAGYVVWNGQASDHAAYCNWLLQEK